MSDSGGSVSDTPINKTVDGQHHQLAYITPNEAQNLVDQGGQPTMTDEGVMAYPPGMGDPNYAHAESNQGGGNNNWGDDQEDDVAQMEQSMNISTPSGPTGWSGDAGVDAWESEHGTQQGVGDYQGTIFTGGKYDTDTQKGSRTIKYGNDAPTKDIGRPDITYLDPGNKGKLSNYRAKYELNQIKYIQDSKLNSIKGKLKIAGFTDLPKDANFEETKTYIDKLSRSGKILDSWENAKDKHGNPLYEQTTIDKWKAEGYVPQSQAMKSSGLLGMAMNVIGGAPLSRDQLLADFDQIEKVGKSGGGAMDWQERMKTFSPSQWAGSTGQIYNPHTKTFSTRDGGGNIQDAVTRIASPYAVGGTAPQASQAAKWYANLGNTSNSQFQFSFSKELATAKAKQASILGNPSAIGQLAVNQSPYYDFLKKNKLDRGIL